MQRSKLTPDIHDLIVDEIDKGNYPHTAARKAGICDATFDTWMNRGKAEHDSDGKARKTEADYLAFYLAVRMADATGEVTLFNAVDKPDWKLEKRFPDRYGKRITVDVKRNAAGHMLDALRDKVSDEVFEAVMVALEEIEEEG